MGDSPLFLLIEEDIVRKDQEDEFELLMNSSDREDRDDTMAIALMLTLRQWK